MTPTELSFGQRVDPQTGLIQSWFTHGALDAISKMDWSDKYVMEFGSGFGDAWLSKRCKELMTVERNYEWMEKVGQYLFNNDCNNVYQLYRPCNDSSGADKFYCEIPEGFEPDVIISDDAYRYECIVAAIEYRKKVGKPVTLICDNWMQDYVFICPSAVELLKDYPQEIYEQENHLDHEGNRWKTAIFYL